MSLVSLTLILLAVTLTSCKHYKQTEAVPFSSYIEGRKPPLRYNSDIPISNAESELELFTKNWDWNNGQIDDHTEYEAIINVCLEDFKKDFSDEIDIWRVCSLNEFLVFIFDIHYVHGITIAYKYDKISEELLCKFFMPDN